MAEWQRGQRAEAAEEIPEDFEDHLPVELRALSVRPPLLTEQDAAVAALCFRALADGTRLRILALLSQHPFSLEPGVIAYRLRVKPTALSYHLRLLKEAGFIWSRFRGPSTRVRPIPDGLMTALRCLGRLTPALFTWSCVSNPVHQRRRRHLAWERAVRREDGAKRRGRRPAAAPGDGAS